MYSEYCYCFIILLPLSFFVKLFIYLFIYLFIFSKKIVFFFFVELKFLSGAVERPVRPFAAVVGGAKVVVGGNKYSCGGRSKGSCGMNKCRRGGRRFLVVR